MIRSIDEEGNVTEYEHDPGGNVTAVISPLGARTEIKYDALDRQQEIVAPDGAVTKFAYDKAGNLTNITDALGNTTTREYDLAGQLVALTDTLGNKTQFTYTALGQIESITDAAGATRRYSYYPGGQLMSVISPCGESESYEYDKNGNVVAATDALGNRTTIVHDSLDRVTEIINPLGHSKRFTYDTVGNITSITDENGNTTRYRYSLLGDIVEAIDAKGHSTKYDYDKAGRLTKVEQYRLIDDALAGIKVPEYQVTTYERNKKGEVIAVKTPLGNLAKFEYDKIGNVISRVDEDGLETLYDYNLVGKLTQVSYADGKTVEMSYNALRQLTSMEDWLGTTKMELDALGRPQRVTDHEGRQVGYEWDALGRREKLIYPDRSEVGYEYDASGRIKAVRAETGVTSYAYNAMGLPAQRVLPDGTATQYEFNPLGRLAGLTHEKNGEILDRFQYSYDPAGNIKRIEKQRAGLAADSGVFEYAYDPLGRLIAAVHGGEEKQYRYDELGNRVSSRHNGVEIKHSYNERNQLIRTQEGDSVKDYRYDGRGNLTGVTRDGRLHAQYTFDATNRMVAAVTDRGRAEYAYNGFLGRVKKLETLQDTGAALPDPVRELRYVLDLTLPYDNLLATEGTARQKFVWGNELLAAEGDSPFAYLTDHLGSPIRLLGGDGGRQEALAYDEFGVPLVEAGAGTRTETAALHNPFGFTGYQTDEVAGLYYAQARYYESSIARFVASDPHWDTNNMVWGDHWYLMPNAGILPQYACITQSNNLYVYAMNSPLVFFDPLGEILRWPGEVHSWVSKDIVKNNGGRLDRERWLKYPNPSLTGVPPEVWGRVDLVDLSNGDIFEIKPAKWSTAKAINQLNNYANGTFVNPNISHLNINVFSGNPTQYNLSGTFTKSRYEIDGYATYNVNYNYIGNGIISYDYTRTVKRYEVPIEAVGIGFIILGLIYLFMSGDPTLVQQGANCFA